MRYGTFISFSTKHMSVEELQSMFRDCMEISYEWLANTLDCTISISRQYLDCSFEEILSRLKEDTHVVVINRGTWGCLVGQEREHYEIAFRTMTLPVDYFLSVQVDSEKMPPILEKYRLEPIV